MKPEIATRRLSETVLIGAAMLVAVLSGLGSLARGAPSSPAASPLQPQLPELVRAI